MGGELCMNTPVHVCIMRRTYRSKLKDCKPLASGTQIACAEPLRLLNVQRTASINTRIQIPLT